MDAPTMFPRWLKENSLLSWNFKDGDEVLQCRGGSIGMFPLHIQESKLINDLLFCMSGISGEFVVHRSNRGVGEDPFWVDKSANPSLIDLTRRVLPICTFYSDVTRFVEERVEYRYGLVNHALATSLRHLLKAYFIFLAQLEHQFQKGGFTLQKLWFYVLPNFKSMEVLACVCRTLTEGKEHGGNILSVLHKLLDQMTSDPKVQDLLLHLLQQSSVPYFEMLGKWIYKGVISDPNDEFLIKENKEVKFQNQNYWVDRYVLCQENIPIFLENVVDMVLRAGKYLNVIRHYGKCHKSVTNNCKDSEEELKAPDAETITYSCKGLYAEQVQRAYDYSSRKLLKMITEDCDLSGRLFSLKHYFLVDQGDFLADFKHLAEEELAKDVNDVIPTRFKLFMELAQSGSTVNNDRYNNDVSVEFLISSLQSQMRSILKVSDNPENPRSLTGVETIAFVYRIQRPLSLILHHDALTRYQVLFRHLFYCKHVERLLCCVWSLHKKTKLSHARYDISAFALRQAMLNYVQNLLYYMTFEVVEPNWRTLLAKVKEAKNVDEIICCHDHFLETCIRDWTLKDPELLGILTKLLDVCAAFARFVKVTDGSQELKVVVGQTAPLIIEGSVAIYKVNFEGLLKELMQQARRNDCNDKMAYLWCRLGYGNTC